MTALLERMARAAYDLHPLRTTTYHEAPGSIETKVIAWDDVSPGWKVRLIGNRRKRWSRVVP